ncbi:endolytic transglycosylase MltG [Cellulomonas sp. DKR-3]|uniref:Endolytic murein transglycosylase n=1 Tax=Cellulomonas fulva TaxID=2835530 RepID=A0ABS5U0U4_9CELL|nr:endolytic transglycosylase MltG [Cellulomonas fulva]
MWWTGDRTEDTNVLGQDPAPQRRERPAGRARAARARRAQRRRSLVVVLVVLALVLGAGYVVASLLDVRPGGGDEPTASVAASDDFTGPGHGSATVTIEKGASGAEIGRVLTDAGVVADAATFAAAFAANADATSIQPGTYRLLLEMPAADAVTALLNPASKASLRVTIPEGLLAEQILAKVSEKTTIPLQELQDAAKDAEAIGLPAEAGGKVEGWLYPATYEVAPDASAEDVLGELVAKTVAVLEAKHVPRAERQDVLIKASLVEREGKLDEDRPKIARAIENRLAIDQPLEIDSTVSYGAGTTGAPTTAMIEDASNPYNTYTSYGLPPTPIASPGEASIDAVLHPAAGSWLFWVTVDLDTGETLFADTYDEHLENVEKLRAWQAENEDADQD